jgi:hypothetical protein
MGGAVPIIASSSTAAPQGRRPDPLNYTPPKQNGLSLIFLRHSSHDLLCFSSSAPTCHDAILVLILSSCAIWFTILLCYYCISKIAMKSPSHTHQGTLLHLSQFTFPLILSIILIVFISAKPAQGVLTTCYDPSGGERTDSPCFPDATSSACCATGWSTVDSLNSTNERFG